MQSILPALWPAFVVAGLLACTRHISSGTLLAVALQAAAGGVLYLALFFTVAIGKRDRADYIAKVTQLTRRRRLQPAGGALAEPGRTREIPGSRQQRSQYMRGIILAAGKGSRLNGTAGDTPKCLVKVGGDHADRAADPSPPARRHRRYRRGRRLPGRAGAPRLWARNYLR